MTCASPDGGLQSCTRDEYTESLLGSLRYPEGARWRRRTGSPRTAAPTRIEQIAGGTDPAVIELARTTLRDVNAGSTTRAHTS